jgi:hypothetical protein
MKIIRDKFCPINSMKKLHQNLMKNKTSLYLPNMEKLELRPLLDPF